LNAQAGRQEMLRQEGRGTQDALAAIAAQSGLSIDEVTQKFKDSAGNYILPTAYHEQSGTAMGQGLANSSIAESLGLSNPGSYYGADAGVAKSVFGDAQAAYTNQATLPVVQGAITQGQGMANHPSFGGSIINAIGSPKLAQGTMDLSERPGISGGVSAVAPEQQTPGISLRQLFLNSPRAKEYTDSIRSGGNVANLDNQNLISQQNNIRTNATNRENNQLDHKGGMGANAARRASSGGANTLAYQLMNANQSNTMANKVVEALHSQDPDVKASVPELVDNALNSGVTPQIRNVLLGYKDTYQRQVAAEAKAAEDAARARPRPGTPGRGRGRDLSRFAGGR